MRGGGGSRREGRVLEERGRGGEEEREGEMERIAAMRKPDQRRREGLCGG